MSFTTFYLIACIPMIVGFFIWWLGKEVNIVEWLSCSAIAFITAGIMHAIAISNMTADTEVWSGQIIQATKYGAWLEYYEYAVYKTKYRTVGSGKNRHTESYQVFDHWAPSTSYHSEYYEATGTVWGHAHSIDKPTFEFIWKKFGDLHTVRGDRTTMKHASRMISGDPNDYVSDNKTGWIQPITDTRSFENRVKCSPSIFSFAPVPETVLPTMPEYPICPDEWRSNRLVGTATKDVDAFKWDVLNSRLGAAKHVNLILVGCGDKPSDYVNYLQSHWVGGKKNDLVLCYGTGWTRVFGWSDSETVKRTLETIMVDNKVNNDIIPLIYDEVLHNYKAVDWHKFDYLDIQPRRVHFVILLIVMLLTQVGLYVYCSMNEFQKEQTYSRRRDAKWPRFL